MPETENNKTGNPRYKDETDAKYGKLTVVEFVKTNKQTSFWKCICECGNEITTRGNTLRSGQVKSCGKCLIEIINKESVFKRRWRSIKSGAKLRNLPVAITYEEFKNVAIKNCYYCDSLPDLSWVDSRRLDESGKKIRVYANVNGLDRLNSNFGYLGYNIVSCCATCNSMKSDLTLETFYRKVTEIYEHRAKISNYPQD
jgi:hypothetical protein